MPLVDLWGGQPAPFFDNGDIMSWLTRVLDARPVREALRVLVTAVLAALLAGPASDALAPQHDVLVLDGRHLGLSAS